MYTYIVKRNDKEIIRTLDEKEARKMTTGYKKLAPYGTDRQNHYREYINSGDKFELLIIGDYIREGSFSEEYYK